MSLDLRKLVTDKIEALGVKQAADFFRVSAGTVSNWSTGKTDPSLEAVQLVMPEAIDFYKAPIGPEAPLVMWEGKQVYIGLPSYRAIDPDTHFSLFANYAKYGPEKIGLEVVKQTLIHEGRNIIVDRFLKTNAKKLMMFDDDMVLPCGNPSYINGNHAAGLPVSSASLVTLSRLMSHSPDKGIVGVLYFGRHRAGRAQCASGFESDGENAKLHRHEYSGLKPENWVGTGGISIERWVFEKFRAAVDAGQWPQLKPKASDKWYGYFTPLEVGVGEDVSFGARCTKLGIQSWLDTDLECLHMGSKAWSSATTSYT